jgi:plastocyanin
VLSLRAPLVPTALAVGLLVTLAAAARADERSVPLAVAEQGFAPPEIEAAAGERVRLEVTNRTAVAIEFESFELNRERVVPPGQTVAVYVSGLSPGRYEFFDDFHQERRGALVVK